ncbi:MAG: putative metal-dependent hydrolase [Flavobacteriaceae bacterium]|nr:putative metal-dependent hydrolase [Flavobacteriaceae bacterium]
MEDLEQLKYPVGTLIIPEIISDQLIEECKTIIEIFPKNVRNEVEELSKDELYYKYRPEGWNIQQVVNHCIDSHMNSITRFKLALTEENPTIRPYEEQLWAELPDTIQYPIEKSLLLLETIHDRWSFLLQNMSHEDLNKTFIHPSGNEQISLKENICIYAWHCEHHLQHIINAKKFQF